MAQSNVSSCVLSIVASFSNSLDLFRQLKEKRKRLRRSKNATTVTKLDEDEQRLGRSLRQGPEDIGREYQKSIAAAGDHFAYGDAIAHATLAEILVNLNTGLVSIITSFLQDRKSVKVDYQALTSLSERSRIDTCRTLRQLYRRICQAKSHLAAPTASLPPPKVARKAATATTEQRKQPPRASTTTAAPKTPKLNRPTLARITIENSSKPSQIAMVKPAERSRKRSASSRSSSKPHSPTTSGSSTPVLPAPPPYEMVCTSQDLLSRPQSGARSYSDPNVQARPPRHVRSAAQVLKPPPVPQKPEALRATKSTPQLDATNATASGRHSQQQLEPLLDPELPPALPSRFPLADIQQHRTRKPTPTYYSTASTKLGEIPLHKWPTPPDFDAMSEINHEAERIGWPSAYTNSSTTSSSSAGKKKGFHFWSFFWR